MSVLDVDGALTTSVAAAPGPTVMAGLVLAVFVPSVASMAVTVAVPAVLSVKVKLLVPATSAAVGGRVAAVSLEVIATVSVTVPTTFQFASTALTVTLNADPAACAVGVP